MGVVEEEEVVVGLVGEGLRLRERKWMVIVRVDGHAVENLDAIAKTWLRLTEVAAPSRLWGKTRAKWS